MWEGGWRGGVGDRAGAAMRRLIASALLGPLSTKFSQSTSFMERIKSSRSRPQLVLLPPGGRWLMQRRMLIRTLGLPACPSACR